MPTSPTPWSSFVKTWKPYPHSINWPSLLMNYCSAFWLRWTFPSKPSTRSSVPNTHPH